MPLCTGKMYSIALSHIKEHRNTKCCWELNTVFICNYLKYFLLTSSLTVGFEGMSFQFKSIFQILMRVEVSYSTKANYQVLCVFIHRISCDVLRCPRWFCSCTGHMDISYTNKFFALHLTWYWLYSKGWPLQILCWVDYLNFKFLAEKYSP